MVVVRFLFALLLGFVVGAGSMGYLVYAGSLDAFLRRTPVVGDLERHVRELELERDRLNRQLEDVVARSARMEAAFATLERRFESLQQRGQAPAPAPTPAAPPPQ